MSLRQVVKLTSELTVFLTINLSCGSMTNDYEPIAIVGMGVRVPEADDVDDFWKIMEEKRDMTRDIPKERFNSEFWCSKEKMKGSSVGDMEGDSYSLDLLSWWIYR